MIFLIEFYKDVISEIDWAELREFMRDGGWDENDLSVGIDGLEDFLDLLLKSHLEQIVGLVEHQDFDSAQNGAQFELGNQLGDSSGRADDDVGILSETLELSLELVSADQKTVGQVGELGELLDHQTRLDRQLSSRTHHQSAAAHDATVLLQTVDQRNHESSSLPAASLRTHHHVSSFQNERDAFLLNTCRTLKSFL